MKAFVLALGLIASAMMPALAEGRYGFRCTSVESNILNLPYDSATGAYVKPQSIDLPAKTRVFLIDPDKKVWRERFLGSDGPATPFTITQEYQGNSLTFDKAKALSVWLSGEFAGNYRGLWNETDPKGWKPGVWIIHSVEGHCEEVADIPNVDLPAKSIVDKAKTFLGAK